MDGIGLLVLVVVCMIVVGRARSAMAEPTHPVYPIEASEKRVAVLKRVVSRVMAMSEAEMVALVPDRTGFRFMGCPNCDEGTQEGQLRWSISDPHRVKCRFCDMVFPNDRYPEDRVMKVVNPVGVEVEYPYWEDATGYRYLFSARGWREARSYFSSTAQRFGELYQMTGERVYARRAALILDAFARYYPGFLVSRDWPHRPKGFAMEPPYPNGGGKWGRWRHDEMPTNLVFAYDSIYGSGELERLSEESGDGREGAYRGRFLPRRHSTGPVSRGRLRQCGSPYIRRVHCDRTGPVRSRAGARRRKAKPGTVQADVLRRRVLDGGQRRLSSDDDGWNEPGIPGSPGL